MSRRDTQRLKRKRERERATAEEELSCPFWPEKPKVIQWEGRERDTEPDLVDLLREEERRGR